jgi:RNA polymerase sigma-70 factor (ECF subfamily)
MDDSTLISFAQQGDLDSFNQLVLSYQDLLYNQAYWILGEYEPAEDATQEAFLSAYRKLSSFRGGVFKIWLLRIVTNLCYDELRRRKHRPVSTPLYPLDDAGEEVESPSWITDPGPSPEDVVENEELSRYLYRCLLELPLPWRAAVILVDLQGLGYEEAAAALDIPLGTVKSRLARARSLLRTRIVNSRSRTLAQPDLQLGTKLYPCLSEV